MATKRFSTSWNKEKVTELVMLSGHGDLANNGNKKSQRLVKELKEYIFSDKTNYAIASEHNISEAQFEKDIRYWKDTYSKLKDKSLLLQDEIISYSDITGDFYATIPSLNKTIPIKLNTNFKSLNDIRLDVRKQIAKTLKMKLIDIKNIEFELDLQWKVEIK